MSNSAPRSNLATGEPAFRVEVLRLKHGTREVIRTLANTYKGLFVHHVRNFSEYCPGSEECRNHLLKAVWKGYTPVERWSQLATLWEPFVLEITESLDQNFFGRFAAGQVWEIKKGPKTKKLANPPLVGEFWEQLDHHTLPAPFSIAPPLLAMYHVRELRLEHDNPQPRRLFLPPSRAAAPKKPAEVLNVQTAEQLRQTVNRLKQKENSVPSQKNGTH